MKQGDRVPAIELVGDDGTTVNLAELAAHGKTVIYFYPKDDTPGCTRQAQGFTAAQKKLAKIGAKVYGISRDSTATHCRFKDKYSLNFPLLSDPDLKAHKAFGAYGEKTMYGKKVLGVIRLTFLVENGQVSRVYPGVKVDGHVDKVLEALDGGGGDAPAAPAKKPKVAAKSAAKKPAAKTPAKKAAKKK